MNFEECYETCRSSVETYVKYRISEYADREDLLQEILVQAYEKFDTLRNKGAFRPWILSIARSRCNDFYRSRYRTQTVPLDPAVLPAVSVNRTVNEAVYDTLAMMPAGEKDLLMLYYWQDLSLKEISGQLRIPEGTVKSRLFHARNHFRELYPKEESMSKKMPAYMPEYTIVWKDEKPFEVLWEELMGWFLVPKEGNRLSWAIYDYPERNCAETFEMTCDGKAEVHGLQGVKVQTVESIGKKKICRDFIAQLTDTHCRYLAESHEENGVQKYYTFLDGDVFLNNWGFGPDNIGNETHLVQKGLIRRDGRIIMTAADAEVMDVVGRCDVTISGKTYDTVCLMDIGTYDGGTVTEQYIDRNGRTVLWRRFNRKNERWLFDGFESVENSALAENESLFVNGEECFHWYDCITDYLFK